MRETEAESPGTIWRACPKMKPSAVSCTAVNPRQLQIQSQTCFFLLMFLNEAGRLSGKSLAPEGLSNLIQQPGW